MPTIAELKKQLNIPVAYTDDDDYLSALIAAATEYIEGEINAAISVVQKTVKSSDGTFTTTDCPLKQIVSVKDGDDQAVEHEVEDNFDGFSVSWEPGIEVTIVYEIGFATIPPVLNQAILIKGADLFDPERMSTVIGASVAQTGVIPGLIRKHRRVYY